MANDRTKLLIKAIYESGAIVSFTKSDAEKSENDEKNEQNEHYAALCEYGLAMLYVGAQLGSFSHQEQLSKLPDSSVYAFFKKKVASSMLSGAMLAGDDYFEDDLMAYVETLNDGTDIFCALIDCGLKGLEAILSSIDLGIDDESKSDLISMLEVAKKGKGND